MKQDFERARVAAATALAFDLATTMAEDSASDESVFDELARRVFGYQFEFNAPYRRFCQGRGATPATVGSWREIPAAPAAAFKRFELSGAPVEACAPEAGGRVFHSSGTTQAETSRHYMDAAALGLYRVSLRRAYARFVPPTPAMAALMPPPEAAPNSSLSFMLGEFGPTFLWPDQGGDFLGEAATLLRAQAAPMTVFGTAFAFVALFDGMTERWPLPAGSVVVETGGFKGRSRELSRAELYALFTERLGVPAERCVSEYGMSEMGSQFYDSTAMDFAGGRERPVRKVGPPWVRTRVMDALTGDDAPRGEPGLLAHYDLANLNSVCALQTEDYGYVPDDGEGFVLLGRAPGALLRGCSLLAEEAMAGLTSGGG